MEDDDNDEPIATAVFEMVMKQFGPRAADRLLLDALLIALCREIPPLAAQIEAGCRTCPACLRLWSPRPSRHSMRNLRYTWAHWPRW